MLEALFSIYIYVHALVLRASLNFVRCCLLYLVSERTFVYSAPFDVLFANLFVCAQVSPLKNPLLLLQYQLLLQVVMRLPLQNKEHQVKLIDGTLLFTILSCVGKLVVVYYSSVPLYLQVCQRNPHLLPHQFLL